MPKTPSPWLACAGLVFLYLLLLDVANWAVGVLLAVLASIHPSWSASRMAPMEAMRIQ